MYGLQIRYDPNCLKDTEERTFPISQHRSKRVHKKLCKRLGGEFVRVPAMWRMGNMIIAHPTYEQEIRQQFSAVA